jgi:hypothetical protein
MKNLFLRFSLLVFINIGFSQTKEDALSTSALELTKDSVIYDPSYFSID